ncbi:hypothetical protein PIB30_068964, partial [Stylosanthes scabra]|nr:hypothetical protein [Stylosanthes scabra]
IAEKMNGASDNTRLKVIEAAPTSQQDRFGVPLRSREWEGKIVVADPNQFTCESEHFRQQKDVTRACNQIKNN